MPDNRHIYTVAQITQDIRGLLEESFPAIWVEGEVSGFTKSAAGHCYFSLKDESAIISAVIFSRASKDLKFNLENGLKVICFGSIQVYPPNGKYQIVIEKIEPKGVGALQLALEKLKEKLEKEGLFSPERKRPIPYLPSKIGIVTSLSGAAIKDILKVLERRFTGVHIIIAPVLVQGQGAKEEIAAAINDFNSYNQQAETGQKIDVLIVGRGGGSIEDLWAFNEEVVARAIYSSAIPVVSAVGHERDWTIADLVADLRAPTPSVAAELVSPKREDLQAQCSVLLRRIKNSLSHVWELKSQGLDAISIRLAAANPAVVIPEHIQKVTDYVRQIYTAANHIYQLKQAVLHSFAEKLTTLNPLQILSRGYSVTFSLPQEQIIKDASSLRVGHLIKTKLNHGQIISTVTEVNNHG